MKKFSVDLIEAHHSAYLSINNREKKEFYVNKKCGILKRSFDGHWNSRAIALNSIGNAQNHINRSVDIKWVDQANVNIEFNSQKLIRENQNLVGFLQSQIGIEWKIIFRSSHTKRYIVKDYGKFRASNFKYSSILVKIAVNKNLPFIEVGEGCTSNPHKFNQDGLCKRIEEIIDNFRARKRIQFNDKIPVILNSGDGAILFHEILGHSLEADSIYRKISPFSLADIGQKVISSNINVTTSHKKDKFFSEIECDDEGVNPKSAVLIRRGVVKNLISDTFYKNLLKIKNDGHSRLENFSHIPMPRMFALYIDSGDYHPNELLESTKYGVYAKEFGEGKVYFDKNIFYFNIREAFLIENGKLSFPLGKVVVRGNILEVLNSIDMVGNDFRFDKGISYCYKSGQTVNVRVGQPTVKIGNLYIAKDIND